MHSHILAETPAGFPVARFHLFGALDSRLHIAICMAGDSSDESDGGHAPLANAHLPYVTAFAETRALRHVS
jgi:hypothetical protein